jgi:hypothetical protein
VCLASFHVLYNMHDVHCSPPASFDDDISDNTKASSSDVSNGGDESGGSDDETETLDSNDDDSCSDEDSSEDVDGPRWGSFLASSSEESSDTESRDDGSSNSSSGSSDDYDDSDDDDDEDDDEDGEQQGRGDTRMRGESDVGDWAYLDDAFLFDLEIGHKEEDESSSDKDYYQHRRLNAHLIEVLLVLVDATGVVDSFTKKLGLSTTLARRVVLQRRGVFSLLDTLCEAAAASAGCASGGDEAAFILSPWKATPSKTPDSDSTVSSRGTCFNSAVAGAGVATLPEESKFVGEFGKYMDPGTCYHAEGILSRLLTFMLCNVMFFLPGFYHDDEETFLTPAINIILEAARLYSYKNSFPYDWHACAENYDSSLYSGRYSGNFKNKHCREPLCLASDGSGLWLEWFLKKKGTGGDEEYDAPSDTSLRCVIWVLCCAHFSVRDRHVRTWAHIFQDMTSILHLQGTRSVNVDATSSQFSVLRDTRLSGDVKLLQSITSKSSSTQHEDNETEYRFSAPIYTDSDADPLSGLSHPAIAAAVLHKLGDTGFCLLYNLTGQVVSDDGEVVPHYEEEHFDALLELFLCVVAPRMGAYHKQLLAEDYDAVAAGDSKNTRKRGKKMKRKKSVKGDQVPTDSETQEVETDKHDSASTEVARESIPLEQSTFYRTSIGPTKSSILLGAGRLLLPHELGHSPFSPPLSTSSHGKRTQPSEMINVSLLRFVTESLKPEVITLWHAVDNMLSLIATTVDNADRLAALVRGMFVWMAVDEATTSFPPSCNEVGSSHILLGSFYESLEESFRSKSRKNSDRNKKGDDKKAATKINVCSLSTHWHPWSIVAAAASQQVNISQLYRKHQLKTLRRHGDSSAVKFVIAGQAQQLMQQMLVENLNAAHDLSGPRRLFLPESAKQEIPSRFLTVCRMRSDGLSSLLDSDSRDSRENLLTTHLGFLLRVPWVLEDQQRMDVALNTLHDGVQDRERLRERDRARGRAIGADDLGPNPFRDIEIHLNRFTEPQVWAESVLQQLQVVVKAPMSVSDSLRSSNNLYRSELSVLYQGEAGMGPGPIKELLEM